MRNTRLPPARNGYLEIEMGTGIELKQQIEAATGGRRKKVRERVKGHTKSKDR